MQKSLSESKPEYSGHDIRRTLRSYHDILIEILGTFARCICNCPDSDERNGIGI